MFSFGHCPNYLPPPISGNLYIFFWTSKTTFCAYDRKNTNNDNDGCNYNNDADYQGAKPPKPEGLEEVVLSSVLQILPEELQPPLCQQHARQYQNEIGIPRRGGIALSA